MNLVKNHAKVSRKWIQVHSFLCANEYEYYWLRLDDTSLFYLNQCLGFKFSLRHAAALRIVCRSFEFHKAWWISNGSCVRR